MVIARPRSRKRGPGPSCSSRKDATSYIIYFPKETNDQLFTVNCFPFDVPIDVVTVSNPVLAPSGTVQVMEVSVQEEIVVAVIPLKVTVEVPWESPKYFPLIVTLVPTAPEVGERDVMVGKGL